MSRAIRASRRADHAFPCRHVRARIVRAKARQRAVDESGVRGRHLYGTETEAVHHAWTEVLDHDIGHRDELPCRFAVGLVFEIENDAALVPVPRRITRWI